MENIDLVEIAEKAGATLTQRGNEWRGPCPLHNGKNPSSFVIRNGDHGLYWTCYSDCNESGGPVKFVMKKCNYTHEQALDYLGLDAAELPNHPPAPSAPAAKPAPGEQWQRQAQALIDRAVADLWGRSGQRARAWLNERGLTDETIKFWRLGLIPKTRFEPVQKWDLTKTGKKAVCLPRGILIPCLDYGQIWYLKIRRPDADLKQGGPKTPQVLGSSPGLFGAIGLHKTAFIVEGEFDAMLLHQEIFQLAGVVTMGAAGHLPKGHFITRLLSLDHIIVVGDNDKAGQKHNQKWQQFSRRVTVVRPVAGKDITDYWQSGGNLQDWAKYTLAKLTPVATQQTAEAPAQNNIQPEITTPKSPFIPNHAYTLDGTDVYIAHLWGHCWALWDPNKSASWRGRYDKIYGYCEGFFLWPGRPLMYGRFQINKQGRFEWLIKPESADLRIEDFHPCGMEVRSNILEK